MKSVPMDEIWKEINRLVKLCGAEPLNGVGGVFFNGFGPWSLLCNGHDTAHVFSRFIVPSRTIMILFGDQQVGYLSPDGGEFESGGETNPNVFLDALKKENQRLSRGF